MTKFADLALSTAILLVLIAIGFRLSPLSVYVVAQDFGLALTSLTSIVIATGLCVKAEYGFGTDLKENLVYLSTFCFSFMFLDLILNFQNLFNEHEPIKLAIGLLIVSSLGLVVLFKDLKGKKWFST